MLKVGFISYLNAYPFYFPFQNMSEEELTGWEIIVDRPGKLNKMIHDGNLDVSLVSFMEYAANPEKYLLVPEIGLSSKGYVDSVRLLSNVPMQDLECKEILVTSASATSVAVMKILLHEFGVRNYTCKTYEASQGIPNGKAALTIGDEALTEKTDYKFSYDLGEIWQKKFSRNIVFATCIINRKSVEWKQAQLNSLIATLQDAPKFSYADKNRFEEACLKQYPAIKAPMHYLDRLQFKMGKAETSDMEFFLKKAFDCGLLKTMVKPEYFQPLPELA